MYPEASETIPFKTSVRMYRLIYSQSRRRGDLYTWSIFRHPEIRVGGSASAGVVVLVCCDASHVVLFFSWFFCSLRLFEHQIISGIPSLLPRR